MTVHKWIRDQANWSYPHFHMWNGEMVKHITYCYSANQWNSKKKNWTSLGPRTGVLASAWSVMPPCSTAGHTALACLCWEFHGQKAAFPPQNRFMDLGRNLCQRFIAWSGRILFCLKHKAWFFHVFPTIYLFKYWISMWGVRFEQKNVMHCILKKTPQWTIRFEC